VLVCRGRDAPGDRPNLGPCIHSARPKETTSPLGRDWGSSCWHQDGLLKQAAVGVVRGGRSRQTCDISDWERAEGASPFNIHNDNTCRLNICVTCVVRGLPTCLSSAAKKEKNPWSGFIRGNH
jgi:hypothetical protein